MKKNSAGSKKLRIMISLCSFSLLSIHAFAHSQQTIYEEIGLWTGNNFQSSAPSPSCSCDLNSNVIDCFGPFVASENDQSDVCYDEFIPKYSNGYVHAIVFKRTTQR